MEVKNVNTIPYYIEDFINHNKEKIKELFNNDENKEKDFIFMNCNEKENKLDISFFDLQGLISFFQESSDISSQAINGNYNTIICDINRIFLLKL